MNDEEIELLDLYIEAWFESGTYEYNQEAFDLMSSLLTEFIRWTFDE